MATPAIQVGQSSSASTPILELFTGVGDPLQAVDVSVLSFAIFDASTPAKLLVPVQVYPSSGFQSVDPTTAPPTGVRLEAGHYFAPWTADASEPIGRHRIVWRFGSPVQELQVDFEVLPAGAPVPPSDPSVYCSVQDVRDEGFVDPVLYPTSRILNLCNLASRYVDKATGRWFYPREFPLANRPELPRTTVAAPSAGVALPQATIYVASTVGFPQFPGSPGNGQVRVLTDAGYQVVTYSALGNDGVTFRGCTGGSGTPALDAPVLSGFDYPTVSLLPGTAYPVPTQLNLVQGDNPFVVSGQGRRDLVTCELEIPICRIDAVGIENQAFLYSQITWIELSSLRVFNRHLRGMSQPDDRENPHVGFTVAGRIVDSIASGLYPAPRIFPHGRMNVMLFGAFGYTDQDPTGAVPEGITPPLIRRTTKLLVIRDLLKEVDRRKKLPFQNLYRVIQDHEGQTSIGLQQLWLKGGFSGDNEIDGLLMAYKRPPRFGIA